MKKRILHVIPDLGHGGAEHQLLMNIQLLDRARFENHVCHLFPRKILLPEIEAAGAAVHSVASTGPLAAPNRVLKLVRLIRHLKPDIVHTSNVLGELYGGIAGRLAGVPVVSTITNTSDREVRLQDHPKLNGFKLGVVDVFRRIVLKSTHSGFIAISQHVAESAVGEVGLSPDRISVIYRGMPSQEFARKPDGETAKIVDELDLRGCSPVLLNVGRLVPQKGQRYLIQAMPSILERHPNAVLLVVGVGFLENELKRIASEQGVEGHVRFLGRRDDVLSLLHYADVFVFPSLYEGLGVALLEACASGTAVVASDTGPIPEVVKDGETGLLINGADPDAIADAVSQLASSPELRARLGESARRRVLENFSIERSVSLLEEFYDSILVNLESTSVKTE